MNKRSWIYRVFDLYWDGFRNMTIGKTLWLIILIKLFVIFAVLKLFFFPDFLKSNTKPGGEAEYVNEQLIKRLN